MRVIGFAGEDQNPEFGRGGRSGARCRKGQTTQDQGSHDRLQNIIYSGPASVSTKTKTGPRTASAIATDIYS